MIIPGIKKSISLMSKYNDADFGIRGFIAAWIKQPQSILIPRRIVERMAIMKMMSKIDKTDAENLDFILKTNKTPNITSMGGRV
jgi:hypothetical protein